MKKADNRKLIRWCVIGVFAAMAMASLWHFIYNWLPCEFLSVLSPVNESAWEHAKLFYIPPLIWYAVTYFAVGRRYPNYVFSCAVSLILMPALLLAMYSIYSPFLDETLPLDIVNSLVTIAFGMWTVYRLTVSKWSLGGHALILASLFILIGLMVLYAAMTYYPIEHPLFMDNRTGQYGIPR